MLTLKGETYRTVVLCTGRKRPAYAHIPDTECLHFTYPGSMYCRILQTSENVLYSPRDQTL